MNTRGGKGKARALFSQLLFLSRRPCTLWEETPLKGASSIVYNLRQRMLDGYDRAGQRPLSEPRLAEEFQVSRQTLRTALVRLQRVNLVIIIPKVGAV